MSGPSHTPPFLPPRDAAVRASAEAGPDPALLVSLGRLARGLSALFWGLPVALVIGLQTARADWLRPLGIVPPLLVTGALFHGLRLMAGFQKQERVWQAALEQTRILSLILFVLSPFLYWWGRIPNHPFYQLVLEVIILTGLMFLYALNPMLRRLAAMLPDETLRQETRAFTSVNRVLLLLAVVIACACFVLSWIDPQWFRHLFGLIARLVPRTAGRALPELLDRVVLWLGLLFILVPISTTMALLWKTKEVILNSVFGPER